MLKYEHKYLKQKNKRKQKMTEQEPRIQLSGNLLNDKNFFESDVDSIAGQLHDSWRVSRKLEDGTIEPREKVTKDQEWINSHGTDRVDIANTTYEDLPLDWQAENKASAEVALGSVYKIAFYGEGQFGDRNFLNFDSFVEWASSEVHEGWLDRNGSWAPPEQKLPYESLPEEEKEKDRIIIQKNAALKVKQELDEDSFEVPKEMILEWLKDDMGYLLDLTNRQAFDSKAAAGLVHPSVTFESLQADLGGWGVENITIEDRANNEVFFHIDIPSDKVAINGVYSAEDVAKFIRKIRNNTPDLSDSHNLSHYSPLRREAVGELLDKYSPPIAA
jgi:hypothetical protein